MKGSFKKVISASRRIDMVGTAPDQLAEILYRKCPPEQVHTLVIWTKNATNLFQFELLLNMVKQYDQLFIHYSVTGMGASALEPGIEPPARAMQRLPQLTALTGDPLRVRFRFDPIVHLRFADGKYFCNLDWFEKLAPELEKAGVRDASISWMSTYPKVIARLKRYGIEVEAISPENWQREMAYLSDVARHHKLQLHGCCVPGLPRSRCIDGDLLNKLHPTGKKCSTRKAKGQRSDCGCTESWDIGWYFECIHGCRYCYANPRTISAEKLD
ncbi:MAG TPA: DUF1848 family protein [bacterium]|nr:DUF1848 family protein [bacterium]